VAGAATFPHYEAKARPSNTGNFIDQLARLEREAGVCRRL
jgi:hypothetical protein